MAGVLQVNKENLAQSYEKIAEAIRNADFVSFDTEFSGLRHTDSDFPEVHKFDSNQEVYENWAFVADHYSLFQVGISTYKYSEQRGQYVEQNFSFLIHPTGEEPKLWRADTMTFLAKFKFDFNKCFAKGMPCFQLSSIPNLASILESPDYLEQLYSHFDKLDAHSKRTSKMYFSKQYSRPAIDEARAVIERARQMADKQETSIKFELAVNDTWTYLSDLKNQEIVKFKEQEKISMSLKKKGDTWTVDINRQNIGGNKNKVATPKQADISEKSTPAKSETTQDTLAQEEEATEIKKELKDGQEEEILEKVKDDISQGSMLNPKIQFLSEKAGFSLIFIELLRVKVPVVAHCCLYDWLYLFKNCHGNLPRSLVEFTSTLTSHFRVIWDTKYLTDLVGKIDPSIKGALGDIYKSIREATEGKFELVSRPEFSEDLLHDAGFDSSITGFSFLYLIYTLGISKKPLKEAVEGVSGPLSKDSPIFKVSEFTQFVQESNFLKLVFPHRYLNLLKPEGGCSCESEVIWCKLDTSIEDEKSRVLLEEIQDHILEEYSIQLYKITTKTFYIHLLDGDAKSVTSTLDSLNQKFKEAVTFTDHSGREKPNLDRFWMTRFKPI